MTLSKAAVFEGIPGRISLQSFPIPTPQTSEVLVRVLGCTLCGSDLHSFDGRRKVPVPTILGHEIVGEIVEFGPDAVRTDFAGRELQVGGRVTWAIVAHCGQCELCRRGLPQKCLHAVKYGHESLQPGRELLGGLAEHCLLVSGTSIIRLPDDLPLAVACPASCATATVAAALEAAGDVQDRRVCLFGAGMLGLTACAMARSLGAAEIICIDPVETRRDRALLFGATEVAPPDTRLAATRRLCAAERSFDPRSAPQSGRVAANLDVVLELSGSPAAFHAAWPRLRIGGTLVLVGSVFPSAPVPIELEQIVRRHLTIRGIHNYAPRHLQTAVEFLHKTHREVPFADLVSQWFPLDSIADAFTRSGQPETIRIGVTPETG